MIVWLSLIVALFPFFLLFAVAGLLNLNLGVFFFFLEGGLTRLVLWFFAEEQEKQKQLTEEDGGTGAED